MPASPSRQGGETDASTLRSANAIVGGPRAACAGMAWGRWVVIKHNSRLRVKAGQEGTGAKGSRHGDDAGARFAFDGTGSDAPEADPEEAAALTSTHRPRLHGPPQQPRPGLKAGERGKAPLSNGTPIHPLTHSPSPQAAHHQPGLISRWPARRGWRWDKAPRHDTTRHKARHPWCRREANRTQTLLRTRQRHGEEAVSRRESSRARCCFRFHAGDRHLTVTRNSATQSCVSFR
ncbi:hypothetical protein P280DRAFT_537579 [Massarina eburnea CBS 473.64]|uniref:Uncharacterized protein n=1 Tax=Massarina eburnea CBS 473.64 TaxID=1395130 RepID=A0A6A6S7S5_9PLEO|nr:hypothetical protein P280DRAFT_537579 [Massarina eburnea CBS 473.64]